MTQRTIKVIGLLTTLAMTKVFAQGADSISVKGNRFEAPVSMLYKVRNLGKELDGCKAELKECDSNVMRQLEVILDANNKYNALSTDCYNFQVKTETNYKVIGNLLGTKDVTTWEKKLISINRNIVVLRKGIWIVSIGGVVLSSVTYLYGKSRSN